MSGAALMGSPGVQGASMMVLRKAAKRQNKAGRTTAVLVPTSPRFTAISMRSKLRLHVSCRFVYQMMSKAFIFL